MEATKLNMTHQPRPVGIAPHDVPAEIAHLPGRSMLILYGSETGNSQDVAEELGKMAQRLHFDTKVHEMNSVSLNELRRYTLLLMVISTTGQGDMPQNSLGFWRGLLRKKLPPSCLSGIKFTTFGLGDSSYPKYNWAARKLQKRFEQLGAQEFYPRGEGDEQDDDGIDQSFIPWSADMRTKILQQYPLPENISAIPHEALLPPKCRLSFAGYARSKLSDSDTFTHGPMPQGDLHNLDTQDQAQSTTPVPACNIDTTPDVPDELVFAVPDGVLAVLSQNQRVTPVDHWQDVRRLGFQINNIRQTPLSINPGDCLRLYARNFSEDVQMIIDLMGWERVADVALDLQTSASGPLPTGLYSRRFTTLRDLLTENLDITAIPRRSFLEAISHHTTDQSHKERLIEFTQSEYIDEYYDYATRSRRSILEVLQEFHSVRIPPEYVFEVFPVIRGRDFSIASIAEPRPDDSAAYNIELLVALVKYKTVLRKIRTGLCSRYLSPLRPGSSVLATHKPALTRFHGPSNALRPLCALATGTGVAPVHALIQERLRYAASGKPVGNTILFFGNRNRDKDYFFEDDWAAAASEKLRVFTAFSRDQRHKVYIQDAVRQQAETVAGLARDNAIFVVCGGSSKMATACREAVIDCLRLGGVCHTEDEAREYAGRLTWWQEIW